MPAAYSAEKPFFASFSPMEGSITQVQGQNLVQKHELYGLTLTLDIRKRFDKSQVLLLHEVNPRIV